MSSHLNRVLHHARHPKSLPVLLWKNIRWAYESRRPSYWDKRGTRFAARGSYEEALSCYDRALVLDPDNAQGWARRGKMLRLLEYAEEAETSLREALRRQPDLADAHCELARALDCLGRFDEAEASVRTALRLQPQHAVAHCTLAYILGHLGRIPEAIESCRTALRLSPGHPEWRAFLGRMLLFNGQLQEGWKEFEWRVHAVPNFKLRHLADVPRWKGEPLDQRDILVIADQGFGDTLQFCRYLPQIAAQAKRTIFLAQPPLTRLLSRLPGRIDIISRTDGITEGEQLSFWCAVMSLPLCLGTTLDSIPSTTPYLTADPSDIEIWRERLSGLSGLRVGLCWAGGGQVLGQISWDRRRSMSLETLAPLGRVPGIQFVSLQKGPPAAQASNASGGLTIHDFTEHLGDFADTAALIENLDLIISVDTAVLHLAAALGKPTWLLNRFDTCWRWLQDRDDSPWYPTLRQFRQPTPGNWNDVIGRVSDALERLAAGDRSQLVPRPGNADKRGFRRAERT